MNDLFPKKCRVWVIKGGKKIKGDLVFLIIEIFLET
jgi:hypothetical protein